MLAALGVLVTRKEVEFEEKKKRRGCTLDLGMLKNIIAMYSWMTT
jgi:hypothetical protein